MKYNQDPLPQRTLKQNDALHLHFRQIADRLADQGITVPMFLEALEKKGIDVPMSETFIKAFWKVLQKAQLGKKSTTEHNRIDINDIEDTLNLFTSENFGVALPQFPSIQGLIDKELWNVLVVLTLRDGMAGNCR